MDDAWYTRPSERLFWTLNLTGWLGFGIAMAFSRIGRFPFDYMFVNKLVLTILGLAASLGLRWIYQRARRQEISGGRLLALMVACSYGFSLVWSAIHNISMGPYIAFLREEVWTFEWSLGLLGGAVYHAFVLLAWSVLYVGIQTYLALQQTREAMLQAQAAAHQARLDALRFQLNPHFLFNSLNAVSTLVAEHDTTAANRMLARLGDFLRLTLDAPDATCVPLAQELDYAERYLAIEQVRFGDRLRVDIDVAPQVLDATVPALLLQPLLENAIQHGIDARPEGGTIRLTAQALGTQLLLSLSDDGRGLPPEMQEGVGLKNTRARLQQHYGDAHRFTLTRVDGGGVRIDLVLPFEVHSSPTPTLELADAARADR
ncbi:MAG: hypothetical protein RhofKO_01880 [Rhodothermales bacterium]